MSLVLEGLTEEEREITIDIAAKTLYAIKDIPGALGRSTFFVVHGYPVLVENSRSAEGVKAPRIEGCEFKPFNQHYWLAFDVNTKQIIFDPRFKYLGLRRHAGEALGSLHIVYYYNKRVILSVGDIEIKP